MLDFDKMNGLVPAIIQDADTAKVLMLGFMNREAYDKTVETGKVTFFSRTKNKSLDKRRGERQFPERGFHERGLRQGYFADSGTSCRSGLSYGYGYLLGREERTARYVPETSSGLHRQASC